jgi:hypothetical protein
MSGTSVAAPVTLEPALAGLPRRLTVAAICTGAVMGAAFTLGPLSLTAFVGGAALVVLAGRGLPAGERRWIQGMLVAALVGRLAVVLGLFASGGFDSQGATMLFGDEGWAMRRALRMRSIWLGEPVLAYDLINAFEELGRTFYLDILAALQTLFGPAPYGVRLLNAVLFATAAVLLHRAARRAYGALAAAAGLAMLLFLPTLVAWSVSLLKESLYLLIVTIVLLGGTTVVRTASWWRRAAAVGAVVSGLWMLHQLRPGGAVLATAGLGLGLLAAWAWSSLTRLALAFALAGALTVAVVVNHDLRAPIVKQVASAAARHMGHAFTVGHAYKLLDPDFYSHPTFYLIRGLEVSDEKAARFVVRAVVSFVFVPLPWDVHSRGELVYLPEHVLWLALVALTPVGLVAGLRRDPLLTGTLAGYALASAMAVALTSGNVGTLIRHRALVTPFVVWIGALGGCVALEAIARRSRADAAPAAQGSVHAHD